MRVLAHILAFVSLVLVPVSLVNAQVDSGSDLIGKEGLGQAPTRRNQRLRSYRSDAHIGVKNRMAHLRGRFRRPGREGGFLRPEWPAISPIQRMLNSRNLLRTRSELGLGYTSLLGRHDFVRDGTGRLRGDVSRWLPNEVPEHMKSVDPMAPIDNRLTAKMEDRLSRKADELFERGMAYFRNGDLHSARDCFGIVRDLERDRPRAFIADLLVAMGKRDYNRATVSLMLAVDRAETLDDMRIDGFLEKFYAYGEDGDLRSAKREYQRLVDSMNHVAKSNPSARHLSALLAYARWLNGDLDTAISAAQAAEETPVGMKEDAPVTPFRKFSRFLSESRHAPVSQN